MRFLMVMLIVVITSFYTSNIALGQNLERLTYNNPDLVVDLKVGLRGWPLPLDYNKNGLTDLIVVCTDVPYDGAYLFTNTGRMDTVSGMPLFSSSKRLGDARKYLRPNNRLDRAANVCISYFNGSPIVTTPGNKYPDFINTVFERPEALPLGKAFHGLDRTNVRANQWKYVDFDGNGILDLVVGIGFWGEYRGGGYDANGQWTAGPLKGYVHVFRNKGSNEVPVYDEPYKLKTTDGTYIDVFGWPSPMFADFTGDGKLDLLCGEFRDGFTFYKNVGTRKAPLYSSGRALTYKGHPLKMDLTMVIPVDYDFTGDGNIDLIVGDEAGRVALMKHTGEVEDGMPVYLPPQYFQQEANEVNFGVLATPVGFDWNGNGRDDIITGNSEGQIGFIENLGGFPPKWAAPELLTAGGKVIRIMAGPNGSIQGPAEEKWGYTNLSVADWNNDKLPDLIINSIWGKIVWYENIGKRNEPKLAPAKPIMVEWEKEIPKPAWNWWNPEGNSLVTQWRTTPTAIDWTGDGLTDLIVLDHEGYVALFQREKKGAELVLLPGKRVFQLEGETGPMRLNDESFGGSGRRKVSVVDFDLDGRKDILLDGENAIFYKNIGEEKGITVFREMGELDKRILAGHSTSPTTIDLNKDGIPELLIGGEDGFFYYCNNPFIK